MKPITPRLRLPHYFGIEGVNACAGILYLYCVYFWTKSRFGYTDTQNLLLTATSGLVYVGASIYGGKLGDRIGYDRLMSIALLGMAGTLLVGWWPPWWWTPYLTIAVYTAFIGCTWPALEAAILHCPGAASMPDRLGLYNVTWATADGIGFGVSAWLFAWKPDSILWVPGLVHVGQWVWLRFGSRNLGDAGQPAMGMPHSGDDVPRDVKRRFMRLHWLGNGLAYLMLAGFAALMPYIGQQLRLEPKYTIWLASTLLFARAAAFVVFWKMEAWHYRMGWSQVALWMAPVALAAAFFVPVTIVVLIALIVFGVVTGLSYSGSLYYSLDYGENKGEHGGLHEAILGVGQFAGPVLAAMVSGLGGGSVGAQWTIILLAVGANVLGSWAILQSTGKA